MTAVGTIPQLGFIHEHSGEAFALNVGDLFRDTILLSCHLQVGQGGDGRPHGEYRAAYQAHHWRSARTERVISKMIDRNQGLFDDVIVPDAVIPEEESRLPEEWDEESE